MTRPGATRIARALLAVFTSMAAIAAAAQDNSPAPPATAASAPDTSPATDPATAPANWQLEVLAPQPLRDLLLHYLDVARFQRDAGNESITRAELARLVAATPAQVRSLAETEGYFESEIKAQIEPGTPPVVRIEVRPGPRATVQRLRLEVQGEVQQRADAGDADARALLAELRANWSLPIGAPFRQSEWNAAKGSALARLRADAYPLAAWSGTSAQVDAAQNQVNVFAVADSGPRVYFGDLRIEGLSRYESAAVANLSPFGPGAPYSEKALLDFQERIGKAGLFDSVSVSVEPSAEQAAATPVLVRVRELPKQQATAGAGISADTGPRLTFEHLHRRPLGLDWQAKTKLELGRRKRALDLDLTSHPQPGLYRNLVSGSLAHEEAAGLAVDSQKFRVGRTQDTERIERLYYLEWQRAATDSTVVRDRSVAVTANYEWVWRQLDSNLLPTRGITASAKIGAGRSFMTVSDLDTGSGWFSRASGRLTGYLPLGASWYGQARVEAGEVFSRSDVSVPFTLLFRTGGDNSVRGYAYQALGPRVAGVAVGGRVLATGSVELARPFSLKAPEWWGAVFVDAGNAAADWKSFRPVLGYGIGARWRSPVGPLSLDLAYGQETRRLRLHFNVGIAF